jgi:hypothetical protein
MADRGWLLTVRSHRGSRRAAKATAAEEGDDRVVPPRFEADAVMDPAQPGTAGHQRPVALTLEIRLEDRQPLVRRLTVSAHGSGSGLTTELMREFPLARLAKYATVGAAFAFGEGPLVDELTGRLRRDGSGFLIGARPSAGAQTHTFTVTDSPAAREVWPWLLRARLAAGSGARRTRISNELLERIARVYRQAVAERRPPKRAVEAAEGVSEATAGRYVMRARQRGYLGKTLPGKQGEIRE